jgi:hypothetical protein
VIHPQFPNTLIIWKVQCFDVVYRMMNPRPHIYLSGDYTPLTWQLFKWNWMVLVMFLLALGRMFVCLKKNETSRLSPATAAFFTLSFITVPGIILSVRAAEYAVPYLVITLALLQKDYPDRRLTALWGNVKWRRVIIFLLLPLLLLVFCRITLKNLRMKYVLPPAEYKGWLGKNAMAPGSKIANISWSDFPLLFYVAPDMVYTCGLDPLFGFRHGDGERFYKIEMFRIGRLKLSPAELADLLDARYVFAGADSSMLSAYMLAAGFTPVMSGKQGIIFDLRAPETKEKK